VALRPGFYSKGPLISSHLLHSPSFSHSSLSSTEKNLEDPRNRFKLRLHQLENRHTTPDHLTSFSYLISVKRDRLFSKSRRTVKAKDRKMILDVDLPSAALRRRRRRFRLGYGSDVVATAAHVDEAGILLSDHCKGCASCNLGAMFERVFGR
jgi:hypothetical protein